MIRIVCPVCHVPLALHELEQALFAGQASLVCPECGSVLVSEAACAGIGHGRQADALAASVVDAAA